MSEHLTPHQMSRLRGLAELLQEGNRIPLDKALDIATSGGDNVTRQAAFRQFRRSFAIASAACDAQIALIVDRLKTGPETRTCWFEGLDNQTAGLQTVSELALAEGHSPGRDETGPPQVTELGVTTSPSEPPDGQATTVVVVSTDLPNRRRTDKDRDFTARLRADLERPGDPIRLLATDELLVGEDKVDGRVRLLDQADLIVLLLTPEYLHHHADEIARLVRACELYLPVEFSGLAREPELHGLRRDRLLLCR
jgi:hypothetical protein